MTVYVTPKGTRVTCSPEQAEKSGYKPATAPEVVPEAVVPSEPAAPTVPASEVADPNGPEVADAPEPEPEVVPEKRGPGRPRKA